MHFYYHMLSVSTDEMTSIQALERTADAIPMKAGQPERIEFEYGRPALSDIRVTQFTSLVRA